MVRLLVLNVRLDIAVLSCRLANLTIVQDALSLAQKVNILMALLANYAAVILGVQLVLSRLVPSIRVIAAKLDTIVTGPVAKYVLSTLTR